jgi:hypothetical protein
VAPLTFTRRTVTVGTLPPEYGNGARRPAVHLQAELTAERFSISGDLQRPGASDIDAGGQIADMLHDALTAGDLKFAPGWTPERLAEVLSLWKQWHLNDMTAGCEHQRAGVATGPDDPSAGIPWDARRGLLAYPCPECGYKFGTAWLTREIPEPVRARLAEILS